MPERPPATRLLPAAGDRVHARNVAPEPTKRTSTRRFRDSRTPIIGHPPDDTLERCGDDRSRAITQLPTSSSAGASRTAQCASVSGCLLGGGLTGQASEHRSRDAIPDDELLRRLAELLGQSRRVESDLVAHVGEVDSRRLYAREASPSMFAYCTEVLHLSEAEAYLRIAAARASREHPVLLEMLADGRLHLTGIAKLAPHLTRENRETLLQAAAGKSKRQIEELIAELFPRPDAPAVIRKLPSAGPHPERGRASAATADLELRPEAVASGGVGLDRVVSSSTRLRPDGVAPTGLEPVAALSSSARPARIEPLAPGRYRVQFTASAELREKLERLQALRRCSVPDGDLAAIIEEAVTEKLERLEARRFARTKAPRKALADGPTRAGITPRAGRRPAGRARARRGPLPLRRRAG